MQTEQATRQEFSKFWESLKDAYGSQAGTKSQVWEQFIETKMDNETIPKDATGWKMPRSTK